ncbi:MULTISPECIES: hypothetical protein [Bacillus cereus group]|uniref:Uncharacterized protein n=1 Tax=Bacillus cereus TaxID=1396 RepID=A0A9X6W0U5_BACCE|nr:MULTISPECIES: hypothetical protein [Bacillus cereus group]PEJ99584.1 hypothetical protein CN687_10070 [Bacillus toyonensis]PEL03010.1 hypothetical protein CN614_24310 [Bacillus toyonensis]PEP03554.1 hypothetical protein CN577_25765 [Bacillus toyonensis]PEU38845.1 hypothetical protein CN537_19175 [Bacillus toyonensis]PFF51382.1 hypothetical protein CN357_06105 [Bacillus cereus]
MQCNADNSTQTLTNKKGDSMVKTVGLFLRYPHENNDKVDGHARDAASADAKKFIEDYNETHDQEVEFQDVLITKITGDTDTKCGADNVCHWQFKGEATYEILVQCSR